MKRSLHQLYHATIFLGIVIFLHTLFDDVILVQLHIPTCSALIKKVTNNIKEPKVVLQAVKVFHESVI